MTTAALDGELALEWTDFVRSLGDALDQSRSLRWHRRELADWHRQVIAAMAAPATAEAIAGFWPGFSYSQSGDPSELLREELRAVTRSIALVTGTHLEGPSGRTSRRSIWDPLARLLRRRASLKDAIKAGGTVLGSLGDLLEHGPDWLKALLTLGREAVDTVAG